MALHRKNRSSANDPPADRRLRRLHVAAGAVAIAACVPYATLKVVWLLGSSAGTTSAAAAADLHDGRHTVGNAVTLGMEVVAVLLALALTHPLGRRLPAALVVAPLWIGTGLLAPVALGLPGGLAGQAIAGGSPTPVDSGLEGWVFAVVYGGFTVQAVALAVAFVLHARVRWPALFERRIGTAAEPAGAAVGPPTLARAAAAAAGLYGLANLAWAVAGDALGGPGGFETVAQRSVLVSTGLLALAGAFGVRRLGGRAPADRVWVPIALVWLGSATCFASGFAQFGLAADASTSPATGSVLLLGTLGGIALAAAGLASPSLGRRAPRWAVAR